MFDYFNATRFLLLGSMMAVALASGLQPIADRMPGPAAVRAVLAMALLLTVAAVVFGGLGYLLYEPVAGSIQDWPQTRDSINSHLQDIGQTFGVNGRLTLSELGDIAGKMFTGGSVSQWMANLAGGALSAVLAVIVVVIAAMYLLARQDGTLADKAVRLLPADRQLPTIDALNELRPQLRWWLIGTGFSMLVVGLIFGIGYVLLGLEFAIPLAIFAAIMQAVPTFGPMVTLLISLLIAVTQGPVQTAGVFVVYVVVQSVESYLLTPLVMRRAVCIPPVVTIFTIILWGNVFGVAGLVLAIPIDLTIWAFLKHHVLHRNATGDDQGQGGDQPRGGQGRKSPVPDESSQARRIADEVASQGLKIIRRPWGLRMRNDDKSQTSSGL
jgi:predicted PurR-regulated permease PerM